MRHRARCFGVFKNINAFEISGRDKAGCDGARTQGRGGDIKLRHFLCDGLGKGGDKGFAGIIDRLQRARHKGCRGGNVENFTLPACHHALAIVVGQVGQRNHINLHHLLLGKQAALMKQSMAAKTGIVDQGVDLQPQLFGLIENTLRRLRLRQVFYDHRNADAMLRA